MPARRHAHGGRSQYFIEGEGIKTVVLNLAHRMGDLPMLAAAGQLPLTIVPPPPDPAREFRFCRMFPALSPFEPDDDGLIELGRRMEDPDGAPAGDASIPAGMTYLGQFIDHDITLDLTDPFPTAALNPQDIENGRSPSLDLDNVYGFGPSHPLNTVPYEADQIHLTVGQTTGRTLFNVPDSFPNDLPRNPAIGTDPRQARIGDPRNDENLAVAQTHVAFLKFHNKVADSLPFGTTDPFRAAQRTVRQHYQSVVLHDFLPRLVDPTTYHDVLQHGRRFFMANGIPSGQPLCMPVEFSVAAYRLGHSLIRNAYQWNKVFRTGGPGPAASLDLLFEFSEVSTHLGLFAEPTIPSDWIIRWNGFHDFTGIPDIANHPEFNFARKIDTRLARRLDNLPEFAAQIEVHMRSLAARNLLRGKFIGLPTGQAVANEIAVISLTPAQIATGPLASIITARGFDTLTPLWFYILKEAEVIENGERLGPVGSRILVETFHALVEGSDDSILQTPGWKPTLQSVSPDKFTFADLLAFVDDINPIGN
ncbi:peroxidase family protein [Planctomicrobium piriforme]|uniref:Animal haem peroxidase n=1 Tax=Planctomicrobium piriforme TaxID=1576369 RepID=A0A1I3JDP7_9PLAN|nr:heme peroxidase family protein [Planctomicrobium piriforme]SFI58276.1 Animal haem peroxidase [Planctomicrobium piriforme]